jgi:hypothetical protein
MVYHTCVATAMGGLGPVCEGAETAMGGFGGFSPTALAAGGSGLWMTLTLPVWNPNVRNPLTFKAVAP